MLMSTIVCAHCGEKSQKPTKEITRRRKQGKKNFFCTRSCASLFNNQKRDKSTYIRPLPVWGNQYAKKGEFTYYLRKIRDRVKRKNRHEFNLDEKCLAQIWQNQEGRCAITGIPLTKQSWETHKTPFSASIDRIDNTRGYSKDNIQFLAYSVNMAKNDFTNDQIKSFFDTIKSIQE